jgi:uncharacterized delta-60 repeat protein
MRARVATIILCWTLTSACKVDPLYCDGSHRCTDPERPFCDLEGNYPASDGVARTCIADPNADGGPDVEGSFSVAFASDRLYVRQGQSATIDVTVEHDSDFTDAVTVTLDNLPAGVSADAATIEADETTGRLTVTADSDAVQGAGDFLVTGTAGDVVRTAPLRLVVAGPPGTLDRSFANGGRFTFRVGDVETLGGSLAIDDESRLLVAGFALSIDAGTEQGIIVRLNSDGTLDDTFGSDGVASPGVGLTSTHDTISISPEGRILTGGLFSRQGERRLALFAYTADGDPDGSFGSKGTLLMDAVRPGGTAGVPRILPLEDGRLLSVGVTPDEKGYSVLHVASHSADGQPDSSYRIDEPSQEPSYAILDGEGRLLVAGRISAADSMQFPSFIARYRTDGSPDKGFSTDGLVEENLTADAESVSGLVSLEGGNLLRTGFAIVPGPTAVLTLALYNSDGFLDLTFGDSGTIITTIPFRPGVSLVDTEGRIIVAGSSSDLPAVARFLPDGSLDPSFAGSGLVTLDFGLASEGSQATAGAAAIDTDGRIVVSGFAGATGTTSLVMARIWP